MTTAVCCLARNVRRMRSAATRRRWRALEQMLRALVSAAGVELTGIGIGSTGPVDPFTGEIGEVNFFPAWRGNNPVADLARIFGSASGDGKRRRCRGPRRGSMGRRKGQEAPDLRDRRDRYRRRRSFLMDTFIGAWMALTRRSAITSSSFWAAVPVRFSRMLGILAAGPAMVAWMESRMPPDYPHRDNLTAKRICELAHEGDELALQAVEREAHYLGLGLANLVTLFTPDAIVLGGSVMKSAVLFLEEIRTTICRCCRFVPYEKTELTLASLGEDANLIGAARVWHHRFAQEGGHRA